MAKVSDIVFCLKATNSKETGIIADRIINVINPEYIPGLFTFSIIVLILDYDVSSKHSFSLRFTSPSNENVVSMDAPIPIMPVEPSNIPDEYKGINFAIDCNNVNFKCSGIYKLTVQIDGKIIGEKEIFVKGKNE